MFKKEKRKHIALRFTLPFTNYGRKFVSIELNTNFQQKLGCKTNKKYIVAGVMSWRDKSQREGIVAHSDRNASRTMRKEPGSLPKYYQVCQQV